MLLVCLALLLLLLLGVELYRRHGVRKQQQMQREEDVTHLISMLGFQVRVRA
jgi:hypothetical protein